MQRKSRKYKLTILKQAGWICKKTIINKKITHYKTQNKIEFEINNYQDNNS